MFFVVVVAVEVFFGVHWRAVEVFLQYPDQYFDAWYTGIDLKTNVGGW